MKLIDKIGFSARNIDKRVLDLISDVEVYSYAHAIKSKKNLQDCVVIGDDISLADIFLYVETQGLRHLVQRKHDYYLYNLLMSSMICKYPDVFLKSPMTLITRNRDLGQNSVAISFNSTEDKSRIIDACEDFVSKNSTNSSILQNVRVIVSELFSNAMYSAPTDEGGSYLYANKPRNHSVDYPRGLEGEILLSFNNEIFAVACRDPFGSVNKMRVTRRLHQVFDEGKLAAVEYANDQNLGSGLGLKMIIEHSAGFGMVVKQSKETFVFATMPVGSVNRKISRMPKNICFKFY
jgi:hypothetical protein